MNRATDLGLISSDDRQPTILVVDDDALNLSIMEESLGHKYHLVMAENGAEALERVVEQDIDLVLLDIMMPQMDGYEACRRIKAMPIGPTTQVILVSAKASTAERVKGYDVGADDYLTKPFEEEELHAKVQVHIRLRRALVQLERARARTAKDNVRLEGIVQKQTHELMDARDLLVFALAKLADSRDPETGAHLERIRAYSHILADELAKNGPYTNLVDQQFINDIFLSSPLHDIGKVGVPDVILLKPGRLSDAEFEIMKRHCSIGARALEDVAQRAKSGRFLKMAIEIARHHHERFDGSGYPAGIAGQAIPLGARIVAVADVFDALTSVRVYKDAFSRDVAFAMIQQETGRHFDPAIVDAFNRRSNDIVEVQNRFHDQTAQSEAA